MNRPAVVLADGSEPSAAERAYDAIRSDILNGVHPAGTMLSEGALAASIGVSRTPVRTALVRLRDEGWLTIYPKRGALVRGLDDRAIVDLAEARLVLEAMSIRRADTAARSELADQLEERIADQERVLTAGDLPAFVESTVAFHRAFVEIGGNTVLLELYDRLADRQRFLLFSYGDVLLERREAVVAEHRELLEQLRHDPVGFAETLRAHICETIGSPLTPL